MTYVLKEHDKLKTQFDVKIAQIIDRLNQNDVKRLEIEHEMANLVERIPPNTDVLLRSVKDM